MTIEENKSRRNVTKTIQIHKQFIFLQKIQIRSGYFISVNRRNPWLQKQHTLEEEKLNENHILNWNCIHPKIGKKSLWIMSCACTQKMPLGNSSTIHIRLLFDVRLKKNFFSTCFLSSIFAKKNFHLFFAFQTKTLNSRMFLDWKA